MIIEIINKLILELEDIIHLVASNLSGYGTISSGRDNKVGDQSVRVKCLRFKEEFKKFQHELGELKVYSENKNSEAFQVVNDFLLEELMTDFIVGNNMEKLIDEAHNGCYRLRKLAIYLDIK